MPRWQRVYLAGCAMVIGTALGYTITDYAHLPHLYYFQLERRWALAERIGGVPSGYVGLWVWGLVAGAVSAAAVWWISGRARSPLSERALGLGLAWTVTAFVLSVGYFAWNNMP